MEWLSENIGSLIVLLCVLLLLSLLSIGLWRAKKKKPNGCSCGCNTCPYSDGCQGKDAEK